MRTVQDLFLPSKSDQVVPAGITLKHALELVPQDQIRCVGGGHNDLFFQEWQRKSFIDFYRLVNGAATSRPAPEPVQR